MTQKWRDVRVFISSTFRDMDAERDMLVKRVFPQLRERLLPYRIHLIDIDLRWGITPEEGENDRVLDLCLQQIDDCRPFFVGILGKRYGWVPDKIMLPEKPEYGWIQGMTGKSVTELEILYGVLCNPQMTGHAFFFFREPGALEKVPADALAEYRDSGDNAEKLRALKGAINDSPYPVTPYGAAWDDAWQRLTGLDAFADAVLEQLWQGVKAAHELPDTSPIFDDDPLEQERDFHDRFIESRSRVYIGRESIAEALRRFVEDDGATPCLVIGPSGSGKSAALAKFISDYRLKNPDALVLPHFIGASPRSTGLRDMLRRLCEELRDAFQFTYTIERKGQQPETVPAEIPFDLNPLVNRFKEFVEKAGKNRDYPQRSEERVQTGLSQDFSNNHDDIVSSSKAGTVPSLSQVRSLGTVPVFSRVLLVLDALNQLDETDNAYTLFWLPREFPPNVKVVVSCISDTFDTPDGDDEAITSTAGSAGTSFIGGPDSAVPIEGEENDSKKPQTSSPLTETNSTINDDPKSPPLKGDQGRCSHRKDPILAAFDYRPHARVEIQALTPEERFQIATKVPSISAKKLAPEQMQALLDNPATENPLYLLVALEELRGFGSFEALNDRIAAFPREGDALTVLFTQVIERLEQDFNPEDVHDVLVLLAAARSGLSEKELEDLLAEKADSSVPHSAFHIPNSKDLFPILRQIRAYLQHRGDQLDFFHRNFFKAARARYLDSDAKQQDAHAWLADYFDGQPDFTHSTLSNRKCRPHKRRCEELVYQLLRVGDWQRLNNLLLSLPFLEAKVVAGRVFELPLDFSETLKVIPHKHDQRRILPLLDEALRRDILFIACHADDYPQALFQCLWNYGWWYDCPEATQHYVEPEGGWTEPPPWDCLEKSEVETGMTRLLKRLFRIPKSQRSEGRAETRQSPDDNKLYLLLEKWRMERVWRCCRFPWLRSLRPPAIHLGTAQKAVFQGNTGYVMSVAYSPDGTRIVSGSDDSTLRVWDVRSGACLNTLQGHTKSVSCVAYSPNGTRIVSGSYDKTLRVWDAHSGACLRTLEGHKNGVESVSFSPDGTRIVSGSDDSTLRVWDAQTGSCLKVLQGHMGWVTSVAYSQDSTCIVSGADDGSLRVWDAHTGTCLNTLLGHTKSVSCVAYSPNGTRIVSGSYDKTLRVWDAHSGACLRTLEGHKNGVESVSFSPDGTRIVSGSDDSTLRVWDAQTGACLKVLQGHMGWVTSVAYSQYSTCIVSGSYDKTLRVWDTHSDTCIKNLEGHTDMVNSVAYSPEGTCIVTESIDKTLRVWDAHTGACLSTLLGHKHAAECVAYAPGGARIFIARDHNLHVWDNRTVAWLNTLHGHTRLAECVAYTPDGTHIVSAEDKILRIWNVYSGLCLNTLRGHTESVSCVAYSPDGTRIVSGSWDRTLRVWDAQTGACLNILHGHMSWVISVAYSQDGTCIGSESGDNTLRVWDTHTGACLKVIQGEGDVAAIAAGPKVQPLLALACEGETFIEDVASGTPVAWFPYGLKLLTTHPSESSWAGTTGAAGYVCLIRLEYK